ncbi:MAG TPA: hypothetical protein VNB49_12265 [Candidatus Dormibacteraeota bacterium]|nr:hypothetical protein [Candidatus Dormibacteraeota bacterium]
MFHSQLSRKLWVAVAAAGLMAVAGCSGQQDQQAANPAPKAKAAPKAVPAKVDTPKATPVSAKATAPTGPVITVPKGTPVTAIVDQTLTSKRSHKGDTFAASLAAPVKVDGKTVLPKGAPITGKVVNVKKNELKVELASVTLHGKSYDMETNTRRPSDRIQTKKASAKSTDKNKDKQKNDNSTLPLKTELTFKLSKPITVPAKG